MTEKQAQSSELINLDMDEPVSLESGVFELSYFIKRKDAQKHTEDSAGIFRPEPDILVIAVADGFGGQNSGELASKIAVEELGKALKGKTGEDIKSGIVDAFETANGRILAELPGAATTLVVAEIAPDWVRFYNAGDSSGFLYGGGGKEKYQTIQHNPVGLGIEAGLVEGTEEKLEDMKHLVTNYLGSKSLRIEISKIAELKPRDKILLMTDGITDNLTSELPLSMSSVTETCRALSEQAILGMRDVETGKPDDMTLFVIGFLTRE